MEKTKNRVDEKMDEIITALENKAKTYGIMGNEDLTIKLSVEDLTDEDRFSLINELYSKREILDYDLDYEVVETEELEIKHRYIYVSADAERLNEL